ncbi:MAG: shikimate dehydrogenase [Pseudomonadota bacterium]
MKHFAVIGNPIAHSLSPQIHHAFAEQCGIELHYDKICVETEGDIFENFVRDFFKQGGAGLNITLPFKQRAFELADQLTERAQLAGAVNTLISFSPTEILGDNTDGVGLIQDLTINQKQSLSGKSILILGSGGATKGILPTLLAEHPKKVIVASRNPGGWNATSSIEVLPQPRLGSSLSYDHLSEPFDLIINATPLSLLNQLPLITPAILHPDSFCYDLAYHKSRETAFTRWAKEQGVRSCDGLGMLIGQAAEAFYQWHHIRPKIVHFKDEFLK